jgi:hypothetical protein
MTWVLLLDGTLTSEHIGLGESDAQSKWIGIRRHQAALVIGAIGLIGDWIIRPNESLVEVVVGVLLLVGAAPLYDGLTFGEVADISIRYLLRKHWVAISAVVLGDDVALWSKGDASFRGYELSHRGRLDLSGRDVSTAEGLAYLADAASASRVGQHFSQFVYHDKGLVSTILTLPLDVPAPDGWLLNTDLALGVCRVGDNSSSDLLEQFSFLRAADCLVRVYRIRDFSAVPSSRGLLECLLRCDVQFDVAVHIDVVSGSRAHRLAARAVHRVGSDDETSRSAGFRRSARSSRGFERTSQREVLVADGRSLLRLAVFVLVNASSLDELNARSSMLWRQAHDAGLRLERGWGLQARWYRAQLPGGGGW